MKHFFGKASGHLSRVGELNPGRIGGAMVAIMGLDWRGSDPDYAARAQEAVGRLASLPGVRLLPRLLLTAPASRT